MINAAQTNEKGIISQRYQKVHKNSSFSLKAFQELLFCIKEKSFVLLLAAVEEKPDLMKSNRKSKRKQVIMNDGAGNHAEICCWNKETIRRMNIKA